MSELASEEGKKRCPFLTGIAVPILLVLFLVIVGLLMWANSFQPQPVSEETKSPEQKLHELQAKDKKILTTYGWVNQEKGIVRIPIEQAMKLIVDESVTKETIKP